MIVVSSSLSEDVHQHEMDEMNESSQHIIES